MSCELIQTKTWIFTKVFKKIHWNLLDVLYPSQMDRWPVDSYRSHKWNLSDCTTHIHRHVYWLFSVTSLTLPVADQIEFARNPWNRTKNNGKNGI